MQQLISETRQGEKSRYSYLGPIVQSVVSLMSALAVKILTVLVITISNSQVFLQ